MKRAYLVICAAFILTVSAAAATNYFLLAENFFLQKGDKLSARLFDIELGDNGPGYQSPDSKDTKFTLYEGSKKTDLAAQATDTAVAIKDHEMLTPGLALLQLTQTAVNEDIDKDDYVKHLDEEGQAAASQNAKRKGASTLKEKYTRYLKTLVRVEKNSGNVFEKILGNDYEIILKTNPYKLNYGDDVTAVVYFKGKPIPSQQLYLYIKTAKGVHPEKLQTDALGQAYFKLSREGIYLLRSLHTEVAASRDADFESWEATYTFAFSSANELPNTYKEFGFDGH